MKSGTKLSRLLTVLSVLIYLLLVVGGTVRNLGAGLSCPDWPLCQGRIIPVFDIRVFAEYFHRLFAASVSILTIALSVYIFLKPHLRKTLGKYAGAALILLASQVVLGGLTVLKLLQSQIVTLHLATGTLFFATILYMTLKSRDLEADSSKSGVTPWSPLFSWSMVTLLILYIQMILGGEVSSHQAGLACPDFPKCLGQWWPGLTGLQGIHFIHRLGALTAFTVIVIYAIGVLRAGLPPSIKWKARGIFVFVILQVSLGIGNVVFHLAVPVSVAHLAVAELLLSLIIISSYEIRRFQLR